MDTPATAVLMVAGFHVPVIPFEEVVGSAGGVLFRHITPKEANTGAVCGLTVMATVTERAHCPAAGLKL